VPARNSIDRTLKTLGVAQLIGLGGLIVLCAGKGRPDTNAHPDVRGGGDWGFGGSDYLDRDHYDAFRDRLAELPVEERRAYINQIMALEQGRAVSPGEGDEYGRAPSSCVTTVVVPGPARAPR
jgi:hypothetical protein